MTPPTTLSDSVAVETMQRALADSGLSQAQVARNLGWYRNAPDTDKLRRALGLLQSGGSRPKQKHVTYERALLLIEAMGLDPVDYGL